MLPTISIGPLSLPLPGLLLIIGLWLGTSLAETFSPKRKIESSKLYNLVLVMLVSALAGARLAFILAHPAGYLANPLDMLALNLAASDPWGAFAGAIIGGLVYTSRNHLPLLSTLDALTPLASVQLFFMHLANLASGAAFGSETELPWAIELWGASRHPVQAYEAAGAALVLFILWKYFLPAVDSRPGRIFLLFIGLSCAMRLFWEAFHGDSVLTGNLRVVQLLAWGILAVTLYALVRLKPIDSQS